MIRDLYIGAEVVAAIFCCSMIYLVGSQYRNNKRRSINLLLAISADILIFVTDVVLRLGLETEGGIPLSTLDACAFIEYIACILLICSVNFYVIVVIEDSGESVFRFFKLALIVASFIALFVTLTNHWTGLLYYIDENKSFYYGNLADLLSINGVFNILLTYVLIIMYRKTISKRDFYSLMLYCLGLTVALLSTIESVDSATAYIIAAMALLVVSISNVNEISEKYNKSKLIEKDISMAADIQLGLLTNDFPPYENHRNLSAFATIKPARQVGGDFYDCFEIDDKHICIVIADVSGKGVPASLFMMQTRIAIRSQANSTVDSGEIATKANKLLCDNNTQRMFATAWIGVINTEDMVLEYTNAGHNPPCFYRREAKLKFLSKSHGLALGIMEDVTYEKSVKNLMPGDLLFLYTDGVTEAKNTDNEMYGEERLLGVLNEIRDFTPKELIDELSINLSGFVKQAEQFDDITMLALRVYEMNS